MVSMRKVRSLIITAARHQCAGEFRECMRCICQALELLFLQRIDLIVHLACRELPLPVIGVRLLRTEAGTRVEMSKTEYREKDCQAMLTFVAQMQRFLLHRSRFRRCRSEETPTIPRLTVIEFIVVRLNRVIRHCLQSRRSISIKRYQLHSLHLLRLLLSQGIPLYREQGRVLAHCLGLLLHEPEDRVTRILSRYQFYFEFNYAKRIFHLDNNRDPAPYLREFHWPMQHAYKEYIDADNNSRVLVTIHMGDFAGAFSVISSLANDNRGAISLRRELEEEDGATFRFPDRISHRVLRHGQNNSVEIVNALRRGNHTLAVLFDLKDDFGETVEVEFFGQRANFVKGPAELAIVGKADLYPFVTYEENGINCIDMEAVISTKPLSNESLPQAVKRITQQLVKLSEKWIRRNPEQWKYLSSMPAFFNNAAENMVARTGEDAVLPFTTRRE